MYAGCRVSPRAKLFKSFKWFLFFLFFFFFLFLFLQFPDTDLLREKVRDTSGEGDVGRRLNPAAAGTQSSVLVNKVMCECGSAPPTLGVFRDSSPLAARVHLRLCRYRDGGEYNSASCHPVSPPERERARERDLEREQRREREPCHLSARAGVEFSSMWITSSGDELQSKPPCSRSAFRWKLWVTSRSYFESVIH